MDPTTARKELQKAHQEREEAEQRLSSLTAWIDGLEAFLRLNANDTKQSQLTLPIKSPATRSSRPVGRVSLRSAVADVVRSSGGRPIHTSEILARARSMGADTTGSRPERVVDLVLYNLKTRNGAPLERVAPMTWRWTEERP